MTRITDAGYYLPQIFAGSPLGEAITGTTALVIIRGLMKKYLTNQGRFFKTNRGWKNVGQCIYG